MKKPLEYRIVEELYKGEVTFFPQVKVLGWFGGWRDIMFRDEGITGHYWGCRAWDLESAKKLAEEHQVFYANILEHSKPRIHVI